MNYFKFIIFSLVLFISGIIASSYAHTNYVHTNKQYFEEFQLTEDFSFLANFYFSTKIAKNILRKRCIAADGTPRVKSFEASLTSSKSFEASMSCITSLLTNQNMESSDNADADADLLRYLLDQPDYGGHSIHIDG